MSIGRMVLGFAVGMAGACGSPGEHREGAKGHAAAPAPEEAPREQPSTAPAVAGDLETLGMLAKLHRTMRLHGHEIWPDFAFLDMPILAITPEGRALVVQHPRLPREMPVLTGLPPEIDAELGPVGLGVGLADLLSPGADFELHVPIGEDDFFAFRYPGAVSDAGEPLPEDYRISATFGLVVHEMFHVAQERWTGTPLPHQCGYPLGDVDVIGRTRVEELALAEALTGPDPRAGLADFVAVRAWRHRQAPAVRDDEEWLDLIEGSAKYVDTHALHLAGLAEAPAQELASELRALPFSLHNLSRFRNYPVGAATFMLLAQAGVPFHDEVAAGARIGDLAAAAVGDAGDPARVLEVDRRHRYAETIAPEVRAAVADHRATLDRVVGGFRRAPGRLISLEGVAIYGLGFQGAMAVAAEDCGNYQENTNVYRKGADLSFNVNRKTVRMPVDLEYPSVQFMSAAPGPFVIDGRPVAWTPGTYPFEQITFAAPDWQLDGHVAGTLTITADTARVRFGPGEDAPRSQWTVVSGR